VLLDRGHAAVGTSREAGFGRVLAAFKAGGVHSTRCDAGISRIWMPSCSFSTRVGDVEDRTLVLVQLASASTALKPLASWNASMRRRVAGGDSQWTSAPASVASKRGVFIG
jgi:hypothetical protein